MMKKTMSIIGLVFLLVLGCLCAVGCGEDGGNGGDSILGKWEPTSQNGESLKMSSGAWMEFKSDNCVDLGADVNGVSKVVGTGSYKIEGNKLTITADGQVIVAEYSLSNGKLTLKKDNETIVLERYKGQTSGKNTIEDIIEDANDSMKKTDAATADMACKDYYALCKAGRVSDEPKSKSEINSFVAAAKIMDALEYAGLVDFPDRLETMSVDSKGTIYSTSFPDGRTEDASKTEILRTKYNEAGSLKALYE